MQGWKHWPLPHEAKPRQANCSLDTAIPPHLDNVIRGEKKKRNSSFNCGPFEYRISSYIYISVPKSNNAGADGCAVTIASMLHTPLGQTIPTPETFRQRSPRVWIYQKSIRAHAELAQCRCQPCALCRSRCCDVYLRDFPRKSWEKGIYIYSLALLLGAPSRFYILSFTSRSSTNHGKSIKQQ